MDQCEEYLLVALDVVAHEDARPYDEGGKREQEHVEAVGTDSVVGAHHREPRDVGKEPEREGRGRLVRGSARHGVDAVGEVADNREDDRCRGGMDAAEQLLVRCRDGDAGKDRDERDNPDLIEKYRFHIAPTGEAGRRIAKGGHRQSVCRGRTGGNPPAPCARGHRACG